MKVHVAVPPKARHLSIRMATNRFWISPTSSQGKWPIRVAFALSVQYWVRSNATHNFRPFALNNQALVDNMIARSRLLTTSQRRWILSAHSSRSNHSAAARFGRPVKATAMRSLNQWSNQAWLTGRATTISSTTGSSSFYYTTERVVALRSGRSATAGAAAATAIPTLYDASRETENCGVGLIASLKSVPSRDIVEKADEMLVRMAHRGGCGCDPASGDGSGTCVCAYMCVCTRCMCVGGQSRQPICETV
jgi:Glutamine amidotransferases class-II